MRVTYLNEPVNKRIDISVVVPLYRCHDHIEELTRQLLAMLSNLVEAFEIIYVNDGSPQNDWGMVCKLAKENNKIWGINLSRNFGQQYAITAGLENAVGEWVVVMDGDLQDQPSEIRNLYTKALEGFDIVLGMRAKRNDSWLKKASSKLFYRIFSYLTETEQDARIDNFGIYHRSVIRAILEMKDSLKYFPTMVQWVGFRKAKININHAKRNQGESSYTFRALLSLAFNNMIAFSDRPLRLTVTLCFALTILSLAIALITWIRYISGNILVSGYASLILSIWFIGGLIIAILGMVGIYVGKVFERVKDRPVFIVADKLNFDQ